MRGAIGFGALAVLAACGRLSFDARPLDALGDDLSPDAPDIGYFMGPNGDDAAPGTRAQPWKTFTASLPRLVPGDRLNLLDGDYDIQVVGDLEPDCRGPEQSGTAAAPTTIRADHPRRAHLFDANTPVVINYCSYWIVEDLYVEGRDNAIDTSGMVVSAVNSDHVTFRGLIVRHPNRNGNTYAVNIAHSTNTLVEDVEVYDYHRGAFTDYDSTGSHYRRVYSNGRRTVDAGFASSCSVGGDYGILAYYSRAARIEDAILEDNCGAGFSTETGRNASGDTGLGDGFTVDHVIVLGPGNNGLEVFSDCDSVSPCSSADRIASDNTFKSSVAMDYTHGIELDGVNSTIDHVTSLRSTIGVDAATLGGGGLAATFQAESSLVVVADTGFGVGGQVNWLVSNSNSVATTPYSPNDSHVVNSMNVDPQIAPCQVYIPDTSPMKTAGVGGTTIGADIRTLASTGAPAWQPRWAGCGVVIPGVNDDPATSCIGVNERVHVGAPSCPAP